MNLIDTRIFHSALFLAVLSVSACGGGGGSSASGTATGNSSVATALQSAAPLSACPNGGISVDAGFDTNGNGILDTSEVTSTQYVCNGTNGTNGTSGTNGLNALVAVTTEPAGVNCATGGKRVSVGLDSNGNRTLETLEITSSNYICNGANGANGTAGTNGTNGTDGLNSLTAIVSESAGANCANGGLKSTSGLDANANGILDAGEVTTTAYVCNGINGTNGTNGTNGLNSLTATTTEPAGANCANGGQKIQSGLDTNANGILDTGEVTTTTYVCNGATGPAGPGVTWQYVTGTSVQAVSNTGYMVDNASQVTVTLPASPALGDVVQVTGVGAGGWKIAQNAVQSIITKDLGDHIGADWTARDSARNWQSVASSADGAKLVAVEYGGQIYTSTDSGATWTARDSARWWYSVASSADGTKLVAVADQIYTSTDSGVTWTARGLAGPWVVASSADGTKLVAAVAGGQIYTSADSGVTWTARESARQWYSVSSSADGTKLVAVEYGGQIYTSTDSGATWTARDSARWWYSVASSADGAKLVAVENGRQIYTSTDSGVTWTARGLSGSWQSVASSADGTKLVAVQYGGPIVGYQVYTSSDTGVTWTARGLARTWYSVACSADSTRLVAVEKGGQIYTSAPSAIQSTTAGTTGWISGNQYDAIEMQYIGNNTFTVLSYAGYMTVQ